MGSKDTPLVTFVVPCYNSASYMRRAVDSLLDLDHPCEVLLINDGSTDETAVVAASYAETYDHIRLVNQDNANWGGAINHGLELARGRYFKVLDSDDYLEPLALRRVLDTLARLVASDDAPDMLVTNYVYDHQPSKTQRIMHYRKLFPQGRSFGWSEMLGKSGDKFLMIHAVWYATAVLRESGVVLPTGVAYMDGLLLLHPMPYVKKLYYLDTAPYYYIIGRAGQSVDVEVVKRHLDEQLLASRLMIEDADYTELYRREPRLAEVMAGFVLCTMSVSTLNLFQIGTPEALETNRALWALMKERNPMLYRRVSLSWAGLANRKTLLGRTIAVNVYAIVKRVYKLA